MEPRQFHPEQAPRTQQGIEQPGPGEFVLPNTERPAENQHEHHQPRPDTNELNRQVSSATILPAPVPTGSPVTTTATQSDSNPIVAADEDLIEKEWVDKAKQIISSTKDDPYRREQEIKRLQLDYVRKRYGKEIGMSEV